jgi:tight adherence protein B
MLSVIAWCLAATIAGAASPPMTVRSVDASGYPRIGLTVAVPAGLVDAGVDPTFTVVENGQAAEVLSATRVEQTKPIEIVLLMDTSGSMEGAPLTNASAAAAGFLEALPAGASVSIVSFGTKPKVVVDFTQDRTQLAAALDSLTASGETAVYDAVRTAALMRSPATGADVQRTIVLVSDGGDTASVTTLDSAVRAVESNSTPVLVVAVRSPEFNLKALETLAKRSGGRLESVADTPELGIQLGTFAEEIGSGFLVEFRSARPATKDLDVDVVATAGTGKAQARIAVPNPQFIDRVPYTGTGLEVSRANPWLLGGSALGIGAFVVLGVALAFGVARSRPKALESIAYYDQGADVRAGTTGQSPSIADRIVAAVDVVAERRGYAGALSPLLERAGIAIRPSEYITLHALLVVIAGFIAEMATGRLLIAAMVVALTSVTPLWYLGHKARLRREQFDEQLPDVLGLMASGLRTGWGLQQAIDLVVTEGANPALEEFHRAQIEARLGVPLDRALKGIAQRVGSEQFEWVVTAISIQREVGGNLAEVLDNVARSIRDRASLVRQVAALSAEGRISAAILMALPFVVVGGLMIINPAYLLDALAHPLGLLMVGIVFVQLIVGFVWIRLVSRIEY